MQNSFNKLWLPPSVIYIYQYHLQGFISEQSVSVDQFIFLVVKTNAFFEIACSIAETSGLPVCKILPQDCAFPPD